MKTIPLDELLQQTSPLPFKPWPANADNFGAILDAEGNDVWLSEIEDYASDRAKHEACNMALLTHAANVMPELVALLQSAHEAATNCEESLEAHLELRGWLESRLESAIAKATQVPIA